MIRDTTYLFLRSLKKVGVDTVTFLAVESNGIDVSPMRIYICIRVCKSEEITRMPLCRCHKIALKVVNDLVRNDRVSSLGH